MRLIPIFAALCLGLLAACGPTDFAEQRETVERTLTVREIDQQARRVVVTGGGQRSVLRVSEDVVNFDQIEVGDRVNIRFVESVALSMALPQDPGQPLLIEGGILAPEGARPGVAGGEVFSAVVEFVSYDPASNIAVVRTEPGRPLSVEVSPEMRRFASSRVPGDRIVVEISTGLAVSVTPAT